MIIFDKVVEDATAKGESIIIIQTDKEEIRYAIQGKSKKIKALVYNACKEDPDFKNIVIDVANYFSKIN